MTEISPRPVGRPTDYRPEYCERVIDLGKEGKGVAEIAAELDVCKETVRTWKAKFPDFLAAMTRADTYCQSWWERAGREGMYADKFNGTVWAKNMNCRFRDDWVDTVRQENTGANGGPMEMKHSGSVDEVIGRISRLAARAAETGNSGAAD